MKITVPTTMNKFISEIININKFILTLYVIYYKQIYLQHRFEAQGTCRKMGQTDCKRKRTRASGGKIALLGTNNKQTNE